MTGYSQTPLLKKLGLKSGHFIFIYHPPDKYFDELGPLPEAVSVCNTLCSSLDFIHIFVSKQEEFRKYMLAARDHLKPDGMIWISWPKKASKRPTDLDENIIRDFGLKSGLVDVKVCAVDEVWSGLKFVIPVKNRLLKS